MKALSARGDQITVSRYFLDGTGIGMLKDITTTIAPLRHALCLSAQRENVDPNTPAYMAAFAMYMLTHDNWVSSIGIFQELAKEELRYAEAFPLLNPGRHEADVELNSLDDIEVKIQQIRLNVQRFIRAVAPDSRLLQIHHQFDDDPPRM